MLSRHMISNKNHQVLKDYSYVTNLMDLNHKFIIASIVLTINDFNSMINNPKSLELVNSVI